MNWFRRMMIGRYGMDKLGYGLLMASIGLLFLGRISRFGLLHTLSVVLLAVCYLRMFSRDFTRRRQENVWFTGWWNRVEDRLTHWWTSRREQKGYRFYNCPACGKGVRVPKGKGRICITCPDCHGEFIEVT